VPGSAWRKVREALQRYLISVVDKLRYRFL
jgi:hypothetical protein